MLEGHAFRSMAVMRACGTQEVRWSELSAEAHTQGLAVKVWRKYDDFVEELSERFPHERKGIEKFYGECWAVFNSLNSLELKSLEEPRYLLGGASSSSMSLLSLHCTSGQPGSVLRAAHPEFASRSCLLKQRLLLVSDRDRPSLGAEFAKHPIACLTLASYLPSNTGDVARKYIKDPELLSFIDIECYCWSTVLAQHTPMINAGMVSIASLMPGLQPIFCESCRMSCHLNRPHNTSKAESILSAPKMAS